MIETATHSMMCLICNHVAKTVKGDNTKQHFVVVVITPPLPRNGGTAIQVHAVNLIEIRLGERWQLISNQS